MRSLTRALKRRFDSVRRTIEASRLRRNGGGAGGGTGMKISRTLFNRGAKTRASR